ncbi:Na+/H+ antiporter subunit E [Nocardia terpenica]|uniref:Cation:proton antiporter n=1 Tax=Nocardia terpenica TaxID=455432 RepID=A0A164K4H6_9NOCA|nr:Na+/H+ antiporter subunit E [Nocardia terpenica]KZM71019.1 cation:proton antiporter [Nocardia terpenica]MBF6062649.1 Na+/H+ antiporter subunit E [Nocardia terpenica]MBF6105216.1 Na+/H+ antiporter subunit E [Nocardia terpenica]MBF6112347.1 Na+/H+ antiporter subunit E [Nocardia terpenica]MBF6118944.1 Na+/H+ antiporter subunit E [Nocardia terpenica]
MSRDVLVRIGVLVWLALVYTALWGDLNLANALAGLAIGALVMLALPLPRVPIHGRLHPLSLLELVALSAYYAIESSVQIAWFAIRPSGPPVSGVLRVRLSIRSDLVLVLCTDLLNLIPGTMVLEIDRETHTVWVHVLDVGSDAAVDNFYRTTRRLEHLLIRSFERPAEWHETTTPARRSKEER